MAIKKVYSKRLDEKTRGKRKYLFKIDVWVGSERHRASFDTFEQADQVERKLRAAALDRKYGIGYAPQITLGTLVERRLEELRLRNHPRAARHEKVLNSFLALVGADLKVVDLKTQDMREYVNSRLKAGLKPQSVNRELSHISAMLGAAATIFATLEDWTPPRVPREKEPGHGRERVLSEEEIGAILRELDRPPDRPNVYHTEARQKAKDMFLVALFTMMRGGEIKKLKWADINFNWRTITIVETKTDRPRIIEMAAAVFDIFERRLSEMKRKPKPTELVFENPRRGKAGRGGPVVDLRTVLRDASIRAGVPFGRNAPGGWCFHDLRHTATTIALEHEAPIAGVQQMAGHSDRTMTMRYAHSTPGSRKAAVIALEKFAVRVLASDNDPLNEDTRYEYQKS
jgi:integrase